MIQRACSFRKTGRCEVKEVGWIRERVSGKKDGSSEEWHLSRSPAAAGKENEIMEMMAAAKE